MLQLSICQTICLNLKKSIHWIIQKQTKVLSLYNRINFIWYFFTTLCTSRSTISSFLTNPNSTIHGKSLNLVFYSISAKCTGTYTSNSWIMVGIVMSPCSVPLFNCTLCSVACHAIIMCTHILVQNRSICDNFPVYNCTGSLLSRTSIKVETK